MAIDETEDVRDAAQSPREPIIDFAEVQHRHHRIDARLVNWGRWARSSSLGAAVSPMFRLYRSPGHWRQGYQPPPAIINAADARRIQEAMRSLEQADRLALSWCYIGRTSPRRQAEKMGVSMAELRRLVDHGRQALVDLGH